MVCWSSSPCSVSGGHKTRKNEQKDKKKEILSKNQESPYKEKELEKAPEKRLWPTTGWRQARKSQSQKDSFWVKVAKECKNDTDLRLYRLVSYIIYS